MKIGIDIRTLMDSQYSGVSEYTLNLVREILKLDTSATSASSGQASSAQALNEYRLFYNSAKNVSGEMPKFDYPNVKIVRKSIPNKIFNWPMQKILGRPEIDKMLGVDVFISPNISPIALSKKCKKIITIHDLSFLRFPEFFNLKRILWHKMIDVKKTVKKFNKIIVVSESTKNDIVELCDVAPEKVKVIYSGIEKEFRQLSLNDVKNPPTPFIKGAAVKAPLIKGVGGIYSVDIEQIKNKYNLPDKFILFLGTVEPRKNIEGLIGAYNEYRDNSDDKSYKLIIAGGRGWKSEGIYKKWKESKYRDDIKFLGYVDKKDKIYLYNLASLFVYPSFYEGFGFPPLEAMACGVPVITGFTSSLPEIMDNAGLMVDPYNIADMASAMEQVLSDEELKNNLIQKGLERAKMFNWEKTAREYLEAIS